MGSMADKGYYVHSSHVLRNSLKTRPVRCRGVVDLPRLDGPPTWRTLPPSMGTGPIPRMHHRNKGATPLVVQHENALGVFP